MNRCSLSPPSAVLVALDGLERAGFPAYLVGGCVRDGLRGLPPHDWDVCTAAKPEQTRAALAGAFTVLDTGLQHGTVTAVRDHLHIEITTYRVESAYSDGRRPDSVVFVDQIEKDLARRDFTVGAIAWSPPRGLCDPFGGQADLKAGVLRCVGDPAARFSEDALRIARALRLAGEHGFTIEENTAHAMRMLTPLLSQIASERIFSELTRLLCGRYAVRVLQQHLDVLGYMLPELRPMFGLDQKNHHHLYNVWEHTARVVGQTPSTPLLRWAALLHDAGKPATMTVDAEGVGHFYGHPAVSQEIAAAVAKRLKFSNELRHALLLLTEQHDRPLGDTPKQIRRRLAQIGETRFRDLLALKKGDAVGQGAEPASIARLCETERLLCTVLRERQCFSLRQLAINGRDLLPLGMQGAEIGHTLEALLAHVLAHPEDNEKHILLGIAPRALERKTI